MPVWIFVSPRVAALAVLFALVVLSSSIHSQNDAAQDTTPRRVKTAATAAPAIDRGPRPLATADTQRLRIAPQATTGSGPAFVAGRVIVKFRPESSPASRTFTAQSVGGQRLAARPHTNFDVLAIDATTSVEAVAQDLATRADVEYAQPDYRIYPRMQPNDPAYPYQWHLPAIGMEAAWNISPGASSSIIVAVVDTGVAFEQATFDFTAAAFRTAHYSYPALGKITVPFATAPDLATDASRFVTPYDFIWGDDDPVDLDGHGTHVSGIIGQLTNNNLGAAGIAYNVRIMPVKVLSSDWDEIFGAPDLGTDATVAQGVRYAVDNGARVINLSLGRPGTSSPVLEDALHYAVDHGAVVTIAAGNEYEEGNPDEVPALFGTRIAGVITVGAVGRALNRAYYSSVKSYVEIAAPGGDYKANGNDGLIYQQMYDPDYVLWPISSDLAPSQYQAPRFDVFAIVGIQGTSMAAPHVAGLAALIMDRGVTDPAAVETAITRAAIDRGAAGTDPEYGAGVINPAASLHGRGLGIAR